MRLLPRRRHGPGPSPGGQAGPHLQEAAAAPGRALAGHRRRLGRAAAVGGRALRRPGHRHHAVAQPARARAAADRGARPGWPGAHAAAGLPRAAGGRAVRQDRLGGHVRACRARADAALFRRRAPPAAPGRAAAEPRHHGRRAGQRRPGRRPGRLHRALHLPRRRAAARERCAARAGRRRPGDGGHRKPAPALRAHAVGLVGRAGGAPARGAGAAGGAARPGARRALRAWRLYLAGCALAFERGWIALHQILAQRPGTDAAGAMRGAQGAYPFNRSYMYEGAAAAAG